MVNFFLYRINPRNSLFFLDWTVYSDIKLVVVTRLFATTRISNNIARFIPEIDLDFSTGEQPSSLMSFDPLRPHRTQWHRSASFAKRSPWIWLLTRRGDYRVCIWVGNINLIEYTRGGLLLSIAISFQVSHRKTSAEHPLDRSLEFLQRRTFMRARARAR